MNILISLSENDKRFIFALLLIILLTFVLIGYIGYLITKIMKKQGKKLDNYVHDAVVTKVIKNKKHFKKYARKKNWRIFVKQAAVPLLISLAAILILFIGNFFLQDFTYNPFSSIEKGFASLLFLWDFPNAKMVTVFGIQILSEWPPLINTPHFVVNAIPSYLFVPTILIGGIWYLIACQAFIARTIRIRELSDSIYSKSLDGFNVNNTIFPNNGQNYQ